MYSSFGCFLPTRLASSCQILEARFKRAPELAAIKAACLVGRKTKDVQSAAPVGDGDGDGDGSCFPGVISLYRIFDSVALLLPSGGTIVPQAWVPSAS